MVSQTAMVINTSLNFSVEFAFASVLNHVLMSQWYFLDFFLSKNKEKKSKK